MVEASRLDSALLDEAVDIGQPQPDDAAESVCGHVAAVVEAVCPVWAQIVLSMFPLLGGTWRQMA